MYLTGNWKGSVRCRSYLTSLALTADCKVVNEAPRLDNSARVCFHLASKPAGHGGITDYKCPNIVRS